MRNFKTKVLMLGWEFPPIITGGLGQACYGISKALSKYVDISIILPKADKRFTMSETEIIGLNQIDYEDIEYVRVQKSYEPFSDVQYVAANLNPYPQFKPAIARARPEIGVEFVTIAKKKDYIPELLFRQDDELYGENTMEKVAAYTEIVARIASEKTFDVIHAHDWMTFAAAIQIKKDSGKPLFVHIHSLEIDRSNTHTHNKAFEIEQKGMNFADIVIAVSDYTKERIIKYYGIHEAKVHTVHNGIDNLKGYQQIKKKLTTSVKKEAKKTKKANRDFQRVLFLGRVTSQKGTDYFVDTAKLILEKKPNVRFTVAGIGDQLWDMMFRVKMNGMILNFDFIGFQNRAQINQLLAETDVYFMPSVSEPFGLAALEAAQFDVPLVLSLQSGVSEVLPHVLTADYWDTETFANYIYTLLEYPALAKELTTLTKEDIKNATWDAAALKVIALYEKLVPKEDEFMFI